jgi:cytochrome c556|mmetsp:Transcript_119262/g.186147  ORF Transcript_119262/g.186147 Transcript_119262/m.186147 type:complete len:550 (-) Transcript_119262:62-1711(-)
MPAATDAERPEHLQTTEESIEAVPGSLAAAALARNARSNINGSASISIEDIDRSPGSTYNELSRVSEDGETSQMFARPSCETSISPDRGMQDRSGVNTSKTESYYIGDEIPSTNGTDHGTDHGDELQAVVSPTDVMANGDRGLCEKLTAEFKDLLRQRNAELAAKTEVKERLLAEMCELRDRSTQEARTYNELYHEIGGVGELLRCEVARSNELPSLLEAELQNEAYQRRNWEEELQQECLEMQRRVQEKEHQVAQMEETRRSLEKNLQTALNNAVWLQRDLEDARKVKARIQGQQDKMDAVIRGLKSEIESEQQAHDTWMTRAANEDWRDKEPYRAQEQKFTEEEQEICAEIEREKKRFDEAKQRLLDEGEAREKELLLTEEGIIKATKDLEIQRQNTLRWEELRYKQAEIQKEMSDLRTVEMQCDQAQRQILELRKEQATRPSSAELRQKIKLEEVELKQAIDELDRDLRQAQEHAKILQNRQEEAEASSRGFLGFLCRPWRRRSENPIDVEAQTIGAQSRREPPLPAPNTAPVVVNKEMGIMRDKN